MEGPTSVIHTGTDEFGNIVFYVMDKSSSPSKASKEDLRSSSIAENVIPGEDGILQPIDQLTLQSTAVQDVSVKLTASSQAQFSTSLLPQRSNISIIPQENAPLTPRYTKSLLPTSLLKNMSVPNTSGDITTCRASSEISHINHLSGNIQQPTAMELSQNCVLVNKQSNCTSLPQTKTSGVTNISVLNPTTNDTVPIVAQCNNGLNFDYTSAQTDVEPVIQSNPCVFQQSVLPQGTSQTYITGNTVPVQQTSTVDFTHPKNTYVQQIVEDIPHNNTHQLSYSLLTPGISQPSRTLSQNASNRSVNTSQFLQADHSSTIPAVTSSLTVPDVMNLQQTSMAASVSDTTTNIDASQLLNGLPEDTLESIHSLLEAVGVDQSQLDQMSGEETDMTTEVEKFNQKLRESQKNVVTVDRVVPDTQLTSGHPDQGKVSLLTSSKKLNGQTSDISLHVPQINRNQSDVKRSTSNPTQQVNVSGTPSVSDAPSSSPVVPNSTLSEIMVDLHIKPFEKEIGCLEPATLNADNTYMPESVAAKVKKTVSIYKVDFSRHPQICLCITEEPGNQIPVEQIWSNGTQMYFLPQIAVIVISLQECVGFLRENNWHISVAEVTQRLLPSLRHELEKYLIAEDFKKEFLSFEEIGYLKQRGCIDMNTKSCTMISLQTLRRACQHLKEKIKGKQENVVLDCAAVGSFYRKIFENRTHCSRCGGMIKMIDRPDRYILLDTVSLTMSEEGNQHFQSLYVRKESEEKCQRRSVFIGVIYVLNNTINGFKIDNKIFVSVKELVNQHIFTLSLLQDSLQDLQYRPRPAPSSVDLHFLNQGLDLNNTLWVDMMTVRCMCSMVKVSSASKINKLVQRIACGQYFTKFNTELKTVDDTYTDRETVFTLDPLTLKITTKRKQTISLCMPRNYVKNNDAIPKQYKGWRCTPQARMNLTVKDSDEESKSRSEESAGKYFTSENGNLKPGVYCVDGKDLAKFLASKTNISLQNNTNSQASKDQLITMDNREEGKEATAFELKPWLNNTDKEEEEKVTAFQLKDEFRNIDSEEEEKGVTTFQTKKKMPDTMHIVPIRYRNKKIRSVDKRLITYPINSSPVVGKERTAVKKSKNSSTVVEEVGSTVKNPKNSLPLVENISKSKKIQKKSKVGKGQHIKVAVQKKACQPPETRKMVTYKNPVDELEDAVYALEKGYSWNEQSLENSINEEPLSDPSIDVSLLINTLNSQNDRTIFQNRNVIVETRPVHSPSYLALTGAHHETDLTSREQGSREDSPGPDIFYTNKVTHVQQDLQENSQLNPRHITDFKNKLYNSSVNLQSTPCKTSVSSASKSPLLSPVVWRSPSKQTISSSGICRESEISGTKTSPRREMVFTNASKAENTVLVAHKETASIRSNDAEKQLISTENSSVQLPDSSETDTLEPSNKNVPQDKSLRSLNIDTDINEADDLHTKNDNALIDKKLEQSSCMLTPNSPRIFTTPISSPDKRRNTDEQLSRITELYNKCASLDETLSSDQSLHVLAVVAEAFNEDSQLTKDISLDKLHEKSQCNMDETYNVCKLKSKALSYMKSYLQHVELDGFLCEQNQTKFKFKFRGTAGAKLKGLMAKEETKKKFLCLLSKLILYTCLYNENSEEMDEKLAAPSDDSCMVRSDIDIQKAKHSNTVLKRSYRKGSLKRCAKTKKLPKANLTRSSGKSVSRVIKTNKSKGLSLNPKPKSSPGHATYSETLCTMENVAVLTSSNVLQSKDELGDKSGNVNFPLDSGNVSTVILGETSRQSARRKRKIDDATAKTEKKAKSS